MKEKAVFVGTDGSMGLRKNESYNIRIEADSRFIYVYFHNKVCPYQGMKKLLENWKF